MNRIRQLRKAHKLSLVQLASELHDHRHVTITADAISKYERNQREPKLKFWHELASYFNVSIAYLQGFSNSKHAIELHLDNAASLEQQLARTMESQYTHLLQERFLALRHLFILHGTENISKADKKRINDEFGVIENAVNEDGIFDRKMFNQMTEIINTAFYAYLDMQNGNIQAENSFNQMLALSNQFYNNDGSIKQVPQSKTSY
jgi:transcriptional regulator with XRE-family HTH domain